MRFLPFLAMPLALVLAACKPAPPPPLPAAQSAKGDHAASIALPAQGAALKAKLYASSRAEVKEGGYVELRVFANERQCIFDQISRVPPMGPGFSVNLHCEVDVPADTPFTFRAEQVDKDATTREVKLEASYAR